jgi:hypothetical protein
VCCAPLRTQCPDLGSRWPPRRCHASRGCAWLASYPNTVKECKSDAFFSALRNLWTRPVWEKVHHNPAPSIHRSSGSTCHEARATKYILSKDAGVATHRRERRFTWTHPVTGRIRCGDASPGEEVNWTHPAAARGMSHPYYPCGGILAGQRQIACFCPGCGKERGSRPRLLWIWSSVHMWFP